MVVLFFAMSPPARRRPGGGDFLKSMWQAVTTVNGLLVLQCLWNTRRCGALARASLVNVHENCLTEMHVRHLPLWNTCPRINVHKIVCLKCMCGTCRCGAQCDSSNQSLTARPPPIWKAHCASLSDPAANDSYRWLIVRASLDESM